LLGLADARILRAFVFFWALASTASSRVTLIAALVIEADVSKRVPVAVPHDEAGGLFLDGPRLREAGLRA
jgi:hypothetical protein